MCFVLSCRTKFTAILMQLWLSQLIIIGRSNNVPTSSKRLRIQAACATAFDAAWYSASADDLATSVYFLLLQIVGVDPKPMKHPKVDFQSLGSLPKSLSQNPEGNTASPLR